MSLEGSISVAEVSSKKVGSRKKRNDLSGK